jgi:hypothetical protein
MSQNKDERITFRVSQEQYDLIAKKADSAEMPIGTYVRAAALKHKIVRVEGLKEVVHELKSIGRNLNQITTLANMGQIQAIDLSRLTDQMYDIYERIGGLMREEKQ